MKLSIKKDSSVVCLLPVAPLCLRTLCLFVCDRSWADAVQSFSYNFIIPLLPPKNYFSQLAFWMSSYLRVSSLMDKDLKVAFAAGKFWYMRPFTRLISIHLLSYSEFLVMPYYAQFIHPYVTRNNKNTCVLAGTIYKSQWGIHFFTYKNLSVLRKVYLNYTKCLS